MDHVSYRSMLGSTGRVTLQDEDYLIVGKEGSTTRIDINFTKRHIRIYTDNLWHFWPLTTDSQTRDFQCPSDAATVRKDL